MSLGSDSAGAADPPRPRPRPTLPERKDRHTGLVVGIAVAVVAILIGAGFLIFKLIDSGDQIPRGGQVAIPNDPTNQSRALLVVQETGLIELRGGGTVLSTPADIDQVAFNASGGTAVIVDRPPAELAGILAGLEDTIRG